MFSFFKKKEIPKQRVFKQNDGRYSIHFYKGKNGVKTEVRDLNESTIENIIEQFNELKGK